MNNEPRTFHQELESLINRFSMENGSDTPDWILANFLNGCLIQFDCAVKVRDRWYGNKGLGVMRAEQEVPPQKEPE